ncbi:FUSC family protein [Phenylobacterium sp.]|jgi:uncharacterized membrane protein YccC|uniref:FUSC family protein n=1 Tax=Phenylobacterium sp. TaxID=1871053 RepID=UPI002F414898
MPPRTPGLIFALNSFAAAMLAFYIACAVGLPRPYWALLTVYITSQPLSGAVRSKAIYRIFGTLLGAAVAVMVTPALVNSPALLSLALCSWTGLCIYLSLLDRTPRSYVFLLAGYTAVIVAVPTVGQPETVFAVAVARVEEIVLGVLCTALTHSLFFPQSVGEALRRRVQGWLRDARTWAEEIFAGRQDDAKNLARRKLLADIADIRILSTHLPFDTSHLAVTRRLIYAIQDRMGLAPPLAVAIADRLAVLQAEAAASPELQDVLARTAHWIGDPDGSRAGGAALTDALRTFDPPLGAQAAWRDLVLGNLVDRAVELVRVVQELRDLRHAVESESPSIPRLDDPEVRRPGATLHSDPVLALLAAAPVMLAMLAACALWIATGWPDGGLAVIGIGVFGSILAAQENPVPAFTVFLRWSLVALAVVCLYEFAILPRVDGFVLLALVLAPAFIVSGYFMTRPTTALPALVVVLTLCNSLALTDRYTADFAGFLNASFALLFGIAAGLLANRLLRTVSAAWLARRVLCAGWRELAALAGAEVPPDRASLVARMVDRVGLLTGRLALTPVRDDRSASEALSEVRGALNLQQLQTAVAALGEGEAPARRLLAEIGRGYRALSRSGGLEHLGAPPELAASALADLDRALGAAADGSPVDLRRRAGAHALVSLRRSLFPQAPPYVQGSSA